MNQKPVIPKNVLAVLIARNVTQRLQRRKMRSSVSIDGDGIRPTTNVFGQ